MKRNNEAPINLGGLTKSAAAMMAAKHVSALKASSKDTGDGDIEFVGVVPGHGSKLTSRTKKEMSDGNIPNKLPQMPLLSNSLGSAQASASSELARAAARQMAESRIESVGSASPALNFSNLPSVYSSLGGTSNSPYTNLMAAAAARDPYYQALLASGLGGSSGNAGTGLDINSVDLLQKCKYPSFNTKITNLKM